MNAQQRQWVAEATEVLLPVEVAEEFTLWTIQNESNLEGLSMEIGWDAWYELQRVAEATWRGV